MSHTETEKTDAIHALHHDAKGFPGGIAALAAIIGRSAGVMHNKFADSMPAYEITDREADALALAIAGKTGKQAYIEAKCAAHGGVFVPLHEGRAGVEDLMAAQLDMMRRFGELAQEFTEARADAVITPDEFSALKVAGNRVVRAVLAFVQEIGTQVQVSEDDARA
ncbi:MAG: phage regulatory CII family protein [Armatimonadia bacterium]